MSAVRPVEAGKGGTVVALPTRRRFAVEASPHDGRPSGDPDGDAAVLRSYVGILLGSWRLVAGTLVAALAAGGGYYAMRTPTYQTDALVQLEEKQKGIAGLEDLSDVVKTQSPADTEIEILRSRFLLGAVVDKLELELTAAPRAFPVFGRAVARWRPSDGPASPLLGQARYAWGGERIALQKLEVPPTWFGAGLTLTARGEGRFDLYGPEGQLVVGGGVVGESSANHVAGGVTIKVSELVARPGTEFRVSRLSRLAAIEALQERLSVVEKGKKTGVIRLSLEGEDPTQIARILDTAQEVYVQQNVERKTAEAEQTLQFIERQLPELKAKLEAAESALNAYRTRTGSVDVSLETKANLDQSADVERELTTLRLQFDESKGKYTEDHPMMKAMRGKLGHLEGQRSRLDSRFKRLPESELESARRLRDVKVASELYLLLLNKSQELKVVKSGTIGSVRVLDAASVPFRPMGPRLPNTLAVAAAAGLLLGVAAAFAKKSLDVGVDDPEVLESELDLPVLAAVPHSPTQKKQERRRRRGGGVPVLASSHASDLAVEAIRSMRTALEFTFADAANNVVAIAGPSPGLGKSFVAVNLAYVLADSGRRVLLVDADLRRGHLHDHFGGKATTGLGDLLRDGGEAAAVVQRDVGSNLDFLPAGGVRLKPAELLSGGRYEEILAWASAAYDVVVVDTAPALAVADGALAARVAGTTLLVLRSGQHPLREVTATLKRLAQAGVEVKGAILNDVKATSGHAYAYGAPYKYG